MDVQPREPWDLSAWECLMLVVLQVCYFCWRFAHTSSACSLRVGRAAVMSQVYSFVPGDAGDWDTFGDRDLIDQC